MRKVIKWGLWLLLALVAVGIVAGLYNRERLMRLYHVNSLFSESRIISNFSNMEDLFLSVPIPRSGAPVAWAEQAVELPKTYEFEGATKDISTWLAKTQTTSFLVVQDGKIASESYFLDTGKGDKRISWSMAKSFLSAAFGLAVERGDIKNLDDQVTDYVEALRGTAYEGVTIRNVLQMASGVLFNEDYLDFNSDINKMGRTLALGGSMDAFAAGLHEKLREPGVERKYTSIDTHVLAMVLRQATGKSLAQIIGDDVISPLGFEQDAYYVTDGYGVSFALGGLNVSTRDYARFGQMFLDKGQWNGKQIIPESWAEQSVRDTAPKPEAIIPFGYGYQWWVPPNPVEEFFAAGIYGQYIYINRRTRTVIVKTSAHRGFRNDNARGNTIKRETIEMFRAIATGLN